MVAVEEKRISTVYSASILLAIRIVGAVLQLGLVGTVAYYYSIEEVGLNGLLWSVALVARIAGPIGIDTTGMKRQAPLWHAGREQEASALARRDARVIFRLWLIVIIATAAAAVITQLAYDKYGGWLIALGITAASSAMHRVFITQRQARNAPTLGQFLESIALPGLAIIGALICAWNAPKLLIASQVLAIVCVAFILFLTSPIKRTSAPCSTEPIGWRTSITLGMGAIFTALTIRAPMFLMGMQSLASAGEYEVAQKVQSAGSMGTTAVSTIFMPRIVNNLEHAWQLTRIAIQAALLSMFVPMVLLLTMILFGEMVFVDYLGEEYRGAWVVSVLLLISATMNAATSATSYVLMFGNRERFYTAIAILQLVIVVGGALLFGVDSAIEMARWVIIGEALRGIALTCGFAAHLKCVMAADKVKTVS